MENSRIGILTLGVTALLASALAGCRSTGDAPSRSSDSAATTMGARLLRASTEIIGQSVEGRPIEAITLGEGSTARSILIIATIHGNESAGTPLVRRLADEVHADRALFAASRLIIVPVANPDGLADRRRTNARGVDLNRNFAASNHRTSHRGGPGELSEPEAEALAALIEREHPRAIISLHQPLACVDYDGPGEALAELLAQSTGLPVRKLGARPGSLGSFAGVDLGIPIITLELPGAASRWDVDELWDRYGHALLTAIRHVNNLDPIRAGAIGPTSR